MTLPFSGTTSNLTGLPTITGDVQLASNNIVSGFDITGDVTGETVGDHLERSPAVVVAQQPDRCQHELEGTAVEAR